MMNIIKRLNPLGLICFSLAVLVTIAIVFTSATYAYWQATYEQEDLNIVKTGCFSLDFNDENSQSISIPIAYPISEDEAMNQIPYTFTITNTCSLDMYYNITLNTVGNSDLDNSIDYKLIDENDNVTGPTIIGTISQYTDYNGKEYSDENGTYNILTSYILTSGKLSAATMNDDNSEIIAPGESKTYRLYLWIDEAVSDTNTMAKTFEGKIIVTSTTQGNNVTIYKCKRAIRLHQESCQSDESIGCKAAGMSETDTITYGSLGTSGALTVGDAFDCDVNGDGYYDSTNERFYYVSDKYVNTTNPGENESVDNFDNKYAVLVYSNNTYEGFVNNTQAVRYSSGDNAWTTGPDIAKTSLPVTQEWSNIKLSNTTRNITDENGTQRIGNFNYSGYAARLLTYQEVSKACKKESVTINNDGVFDEKCIFLLENTKYQIGSSLYGYWLENVNSNESHANTAWTVYGNSRRVGGDPVSTENDGVRPAIEVLKSDINY